MNHDFAHEPLSSDDLALVGARLFDVAFDGFTSIFGPPVRGRFVERLVLKIDQVIKWHALKGAWEDELERAKQMQECRSLHAAHEYYVRAFDIAESAFRLAEGGCEPQLPLVLEALKKMAHVKRQLGSYDDAILLYEACLDLSSELNPDEPEKTARYFEEIAECCMYKGDFTRALTFQQTAVNKYEAVTNPVLFKHQMASLFIEPRIKLSVMQFDAGDSQGAAETLHTIREDLISWYGPSDQDYAVSKLREIGALFFRYGYNDFADQCYKSAQVMKPQEVLGLL